MGVPEAAGPGDTFWSISRQLQQRRVLIGGWNCGRHADAK